MSVDEYTFRYIDDFYRENSYKYSNYKNKNEISLITVYGLKFGRLNVSTPIVTSHKTLFIANLVLNLSTSFSFASELV